MKKYIEIDLSRQDWGHVEKRAKFLLLTPEQLFTKLMLDFLHITIGEEDE